MKSFKQYLKELNLKKSRQSTNVIVNPNTNTTNSRLLDPESIQLRSFSGEKIPKPKPLEIIKTPITDKFISGMNKLYDKYKEKRKNDPISDIIRNDNGNTNYKK